MRAHSLRRTLWFTNVLLGAGVVGLGAWLALDVMPAAADPARVKADFAAKELDKYKARPNAAPQQNAPVTLKDVESIDRPEFKKLNYWIFSGPMPPEPVAEAEIKAGPPPPTGLETLGKPAFIIYMEPGENQRVAEESVLTWVFAGGDKKLGRFKPGQFIRQAGQPERFKLVDIKRPAPTMYDIVYDVYDDPKALPTKAGLILHHESRPPPSKNDPFRDVVPAGSVPAGTPADGVAKGTTADGRPAVGTVPATGSTPEAPRPEPKFEDISPTITRQGADKVEVEFDQATYDFVRGKSVESLAEKVKTQPAIDQRTGQPLGLKITGIDAQSPAEKFDVRPGDILVSINNQKVRDRDELIGIVQKMPQDTSRVTVVIDRNGKHITYNIDPRDPKTRRAGRYLDQPK